MSCLLYPIIYGRVLWFFHGLATVSDAAGTTGTYVFMNESFQILGEVMRRRDTESCSCSFINPNIDERDSFHLALSFTIVLAVLVFFRVNFRIILSVSSVILAGVLMMLH